MFMELEHFNIDINLHSSFFYFFKRTKTIHIEYKQATVLEAVYFLESLNYNDMDLDQWTLEFIENHSKSKISDIDRLNIYTKAKTLFSIIKDTHFKWLFSEKNKVNKDYFDPVPLLSTLWFVCNKINTDFMTLAKNISINDLDLLSDVAIYTINSETKEWQKKNSLRKLKLKAKYRSNEETQRIKTSLEKIPNNWKTEHIETIYQEKL